jgi:hypothetical protein
MNHSFNVAIAKKLDVSCAIMIENIAFWIQKNQANNKNFHDGYYWTYNSHKAFSEILPYWSEKQIKTILKKLTDAEIIKSGNYNKYKFDKTKWYTIIDVEVMKQYSITEITTNGTNGPIGKKKKFDREEKNVQPIPYINTDIKQSVKQQQQDVNKNDNSLEKQVNELEMNESPNNSAIKEKDNLDKAVLENSTNVESDTLNETYKRFLSIGSISKEKVEETIRNYGIKKVSYYLNNYSHFKTNKHNPIGFIIKAIRDNYSIPQKEFNNHNIPAQSSNFTQRKYDDEFFESLYENL